MNLRLYLSIMDKNKLPHVTFIKTSLNFKSIIGIVTTFAKLRHLFFDSHDIFSTYLKIKLNLPIHQSIA
jgi:hypothetical protein